MARPLKQGLDYFPIDCNMDNQMELLETETGLEGFAIIVKLWQWIYSDKGYYIEWDEDTQLLFARRIGADFEKVNQVIKVALKREIFSQEKYAEYNILTSRGVLMRYIQATQKRKGVEIIREYAVGNNIKAENVVIIKLIDTQTELMTEETELMTPESTQSKVEYSRVKKSITKHKYGFYKNVFLSDEQMEKLQAEFPDYEERIERVSEYCASTGKSYKDYLATIRSWARKEEKGNQAKKAKSMSERLADMKERGLLDD